MTTNTDPYFVLVQNAKRLRLNSSVAVLTDLKIAMLTEKEGEIAMCRNSLT